MATEDPWDHNAECRYCDEQAMHRADCTWLVETLKKGEHFQRVAVALEQKVEAQEEVILNQLRTIGGLHAAFDAATKEAGELAKEHICAMFDADERDALLTRVEELEKDKAALELLVKELLAAAKAHEP